MVHIYKVLAGFRIQEVNVNFCVPTWQKFSSFEDFQQLIVTVGALDAVCIFYIFYILYILRQIHSNATKFALANLTPFNRKLINRQTRPYSHYIAILMHRGHFEDGN